MGCIGHAFPGFFVEREFRLVGEGSRPYFLITEIVADSLMFVMYLVGYTHWGLQGVGVAYLLAYLFSMTGIYMVCHLKFGLHIPVRMFVSLFVYSSLCYFVWLLWSNDCLAGAYSLTAFICLFTGFQLKKKIFRKSE